MNKAKFRRFFLGLLIGFLGSTLMLPPITVHADDPPHPPIPITRTVTPPVCGLGQTVTVTLTIYGVTDAYDESPQGIGVGEVLHDYIVIDPTSFSIPPDIFGEAVHYPGHIGFGWGNIALSVGDGDKWLEKGEIWQVSYDIQPMMLGGALPIYEHSGLFYHFIGYPLTPYTPNLPPGLVTVISIAPSFPLRIEELQRLLEDEATHSFEGKTANQRAQSKQVLSRKLEEVITLFENGYLTDSYNKLMHDVAPKLADPWATRSTYKSSWLTSNSEYAPEVKAFSKVCDSLITYKSNF
jgi:hypothetical protein